MLGTTALVRSLVVATCCAGLGASAASALPNTVIRTVSPNSSVSDEEEVRPNAAQQAQAEILRRIQVIEEENTAFFAQLELSKARISFATMKSGAERMVSEDGEVQLAEVDRFHNYLDEFVRAMEQMVMGEFPKRSAYGRAANEEAKRLTNPMSEADLQKVAKSLRKPLAKLNELADDTPGLEGLDLKQKCKTAPDFVTYVHRVADRIDVLTDSTIGLGPMYSPAVAEVEPLRSNILKLRQAANGLLVDDLNRKSDQIADVEKWLETTVRDADQLGRTSQVWNSSAHGNLGAACVDAMKGVERNFKSMRNKLPSS